MTIGIGLVGAGWMGSAHSYAYRGIPSFFPQSGISPRLICIVDEDPLVADGARARWGYERSSTDLGTLLDDARIDVVDITTPNSAHLEIALAAAAAGKHVYCEKPVGRSLAETREIAQAVEQAGVMSYTGFNYRWMPALQHAKQLISEGRLGRVIHLRSSFLTDWGASSNARFSWRFDRDQAGWGVLGDIMSHIVDTAEFLVGPFEAVSGVGEIFVKDRPVSLPSSEHRLAGASVFDRDENPNAERVQVTNEDYFAALVKFCGGARGTMEVSRTAVGTKSRYRLEIHGTEGAFAWDLERMNEFEVCFTSDQAADGGYRRVIVGPEHPGFSAFSPGAGAGMAFQDSKTLEVFHFLEGVTRGVAVEPSFAAALRVATVLDALERSWRTETWQGVTSGPASMPINQAN